MNEHTSSTGRLVRTVAVVGDGPRSRQICLQAAALGLDVFFYSQDAGRLHEALQQISRQAGQRVRRLQAEQRRAIRNRLYPTSDLPLATRHADLVIEAEGWPEDSSVVAVAPHPRASDQAVAATLRALGLTPARAHQAA